MRKITSPPLFSAQMYDLSARISELYALLQDEQSKKVFSARLRYETAPCLENMYDLIESSDCIPVDVQNSVIKAWRNLKALSDAGNTIVIYGAGNAGMRCAQHFMLFGVQYQMFCDKKKHGQSFFGKLIISPEQLLEHKNEYYVVVAVGSYPEVFRFLRDNGYPEDHILLSPLIAGIEATPITNQYFDFMEFYHPNTVFLDGGSFDGQDSIRFAEVTNGNYAGIIAVEPDSTSCQNVRANLANAGVERAGVIEAGLSDRSGKATFYSCLNAASRIKQDEYGKYNVNMPAIEGSIAHEDTIRVIKIDELTDLAFGMIKMDIEGSEFDALQGAEQTILRDKPLLAICVYHRQGDMLAIMDYLHALLPEYRFWLRHYFPLTTDTVLYAAVI